MKTPQIPVPALAQAIGLSSELWLKREDLHHSGSHKGRSIPLMIKEYVRQGKRSFVISSSGNAALAALTDIKHHNQNKPNDPLSLTIFVGKHIDTEKLGKLTTAATGQKNITLEQVTNPKQAAFKLNQDTGAILLRQSVDDLALLGYYELAIELSKIPHLSAVFIPTSSGTTLQGIADGFKQLKGFPVPQLHAVQTTSCHPLVEAIWEKVPALHKTPLTNKELSVAGSIVDIIAQRQESVAKAVAESQGNGWIVTNEEITTTITLTKKTLDLDISSTSALGIAAVIQALNHDWQPQGAVVCLITGD
jgi:threonine synthase